MSEPDDDFDYAWWSETKRPSKAAERKGWRSAVQEELDDLGDLYELPESLRHVDLPGVRL
jgi:hypothetical protein